MIWSLPHQVIEENTKGNGRGGRRPVRPVETCPYCRNELSLFCQSKWVFRWRSGLEKLLICRREVCIAEARKDGWL